MVSIRRRKLLGMYSGRNSFLAPLSCAFEHGHTPENCAENTKPVSGHPLPLNDNYKAKEPAKRAPNPAIPEIKRRKRHRRKQVENQEQCVMRGVYFKNLKWQAAIKVDKKQIHLGTVGSQEEAADYMTESQRRSGMVPRRKHEENEWEGEQGRNGFSASEDDALAP
ncbi:UNVERIFIED_CONTAM: Ethylene-responsive transcription factor-like protein [Sesamum latifolium]|uniref:Ethylene-responsive transcription factor-like protein n=1 Tax=Sesamum latifolium TaxID=2727402 RepID=A0AAW2Y2I0_9LAMI